jgi:7-cyano-7-deazaguanine synthase
MVIVGGWNAADAAGYPDCRPSFITAQAVALGQALDCEVRIVSPVIDMMKEEIIIRGEELGVPFEKTWSCYVPNFIKNSTGTSCWTPCGSCISCKLREKGFKGAGLVDPLLGVDDE